ncbi:hypothetical protein CV093_14500 [Oceanobacillus sp. 143]|uniref:Uncharacterized protein n=1 Tax=Oceanobacillus zhaokaii TaxID=2052660 RepID=A0A345PIT0_9BACI|nr:hypothetical protein [Oceanobacillus zhaokaii]AXI09910.1 hypothetical protein CUC15_13665 [Oceanobacillus zhaokaii]QGS69123.1 hypothetical protein CV093_14500 [Oceanobacillus sp. 143]
MNNSNNLNIQLAQIKGSLGQKQKWELQLADYHKELAGIKHSISTLEKQLSAEMKDVEKLERIGFKSLFQTFFGSKEEKLTKEKQEVIAVQLQLKEAKKTKAEITKSVSQLERNIQSVGDIEMEFEQLLERKEELIKNSNSSLANKLFELTEQADDIQITLLELAEAIKAGNIALGNLEDAVTSLESASGWGTFDLFGGGAIASMVKHSHIDEATNAIHDAQSSMRHFQKELLDVDKTVNVEIDISGLLKFADFFFDDIISDWMVQGRIQDSLKQARNQLANVERIVRKLEAEVVQMDGELTNIEIKRKELIEIS